MNYTVLGLVKDGIEALQNQLEYKIENVAYSILVGLDLKDDYDSYFSAINKVLISWDNEDRLEEYYAELIAEDIENVIMAENFGSAKLLDVTGWDWALYCARKTQNSKAEFEKDKNPSDDFKRRLLISGHSPVRCVNLLFEIELLNKSQNHLVRHGSGKDGLVQWFVSTMRSDLTGNFDLKVTRVTERSMSVAITLPNFVYMAKIRQCLKTERASRKIVAKMVSSLVESEPTVYGEKFFLPNCVLCPESFEDCKGNRMTTEQMQERIGFKGEK